LAEPFLAVHPMAVRARSSPCPARSKATGACGAKPCSWTGWSCGSGRVMAGASGPSNRMDPHCDSSTVRVRQRRLSAPAISEALTGAMGAPRA
jgi:hypothetical protein